MLSSETDLKADPATWHNRIANEIVGRILDEPIAAGGTLSDVAMLLESVLVGVIGRTFEPPVATQALDMIVSRATIRLSNLEANPDASQGIKRKPSKSLN